MKKVIFATIAAVMVATSSFASSADEVFGGSKTLAEVNDIVAYSANFEGVKGFNTTIRFNNPGYGKYGYNDWKDTYYTAVDDVFDVAPKAKFIGQSNYVGSAAKLSIKNTRLADNADALSIYNKDDLTSYGSQRLKTTDIVVNRDLFVPGKSGWDAVGYTAGATALLIDKFNTTAGQNKNILIGTAHEEDGKKYLDLGHALSPIFHPQLPSLAPGQSVAADFK